MRIPVWARLYAAGLSAFLLVAGAARAAMPATGPAVAGFEVYDQTIPALLNKWHVPGAALAVAYRGQIVFARGYGLADRETGRPVQPDTSFRIMSISKMLTSAMILKLVENGQLSLDDHPFDLLGYPTPTYPGAKRDARLGQITVRQLLSHSGGWVGDQVDDPIIGGRGFYPHMHQQRIAQIMGAPAPASAETVLRYMVGQPLQAEPGTVFSYCNHGYLLLGRLIELKTGVSYVQAVQRLLGDSFISGVAPAGSRRNELTADEAVYYDDPTAPLATSQFDGQLVPKQYAYSLPGWDAAGGWKMSAIECLRFMLALDAKNGIPPLLRPETVADMQTTKYPGTYYGFGWFTRYASSSGDDTGHGGGSWGSKTLALRSADRQWHMVLFLNSIPTEAFTGGLFEADAYSALHALPPSFSPAGLDMTWSTLGWDAWQSLYFDGQPCADLADPDNDGVPNLIEYSAGLDPTEIDRQTPATFELQFDNLPVLTYRRILLEHPLSWTVESSTDGQTWRPSQATSQTTVLNSDGTLSVILPLPGATHVRLQVQRLASGAKATYELALDPAPFFTSQPASQTVIARDPFTLTVSASGTPTPTYQWQRLPAGSSVWVNVSNGGAYSGATGAILTVNSTDLAMSGDQFRCLGTNTAGSATSHSATLTVNTATIPVFTTHPESRAVTIGTAVTLTCAASGLPTPAYQWQKGGVNISNATGASLSITSCSVGDAGTYSVVATNSAGAATSNAATLTVNAVITPPPSSAGGGGGGAITPWFLAALSLPGLIRRLCPKKADGAALPSSPV